MLGNLVQDHEISELNCPVCEESFGYCSCGGVIHAEYQETFQRIKVTNRKTLKQTSELITVAVLVLECDICDEYEIQ